MKAAGSGVCSTPDRRGSGPFGKECGMNMRLFERRVVERRHCERRRYDRRMTVPLEPVDFERRRWADRRDDGFFRRVPAERRDH